MVVGGGTSIECSIIYTTHSDWLVVRLTIYFTNTEATVRWTSSQGVELMASNEDRQKRRRDRKKTDRNCQKEKQGQPN